MTKKEDTETHSNTGYCQFADVRVRISRRGICDERCLGGRWNPDKMRGVIIRCGAAADGMQLGPLREIRYRDEEKK